MRKIFPFNGMSSKDFAAALRVGQEIAAAQYDLAQRAGSLLLDAGRLNLKLAGLLISPWARKSR
ncbi:hypothetical protein [Aquidulcibacter sp.]|uniref:hypothetical protein n=1 Tax=Aquidulcibacter sp. TaxID=2052990 RepID=UPI0025C09C3F|nr:hypothetical protein [Aquidulcibacter sp.]MCA3692824.1 hypothetical protein [Aquidulcibacter sp.]